MFANDNERFDHQRFIDAVFAEKGNWWMFLSFLLLATLVCLLILFIKQ
jgi:hypothetical protein